MLSSYYQRDDIACKLFALDNTIEPSAVRVFTTVGFEQFAVERETSECEREFRVTMVRGVRDRTLAPAFGVSVFYERDAKEYTTVTVY